MENKKKKVIIGSTAALAALGTAAGIAVPLATSSSKVKATEDGQSSIGTEIGKRDIQQSNIGSSIVSTVAVPREKGKVGRPDLRIDTKTKNQLQHGVSADDKVIDTETVDYPKVVAEPTIIPYPEQLSPLKRTGAPSKIDIKEIPTSEEMIQLTPKAPDGYKFQKTPFGDKLVPVVEQGTPVKTPPPAPKMGAAPGIPKAPGEIIDPDVINPQMPASPKDINWIPQATMDIPLTSMGQAVTTHDKKQTPRDSKLYVPKTQGAHLEWKEQQSRLARMTSAMKSMFTAETNQEESTEAKFAHHPFELKNAYEKAQAKFNAAEARYNIYLATAKKTEEMNLFFDAQTEKVQNGETKSVSQLSDDKTKQAAAEAAFNEERDRYNAHLEMERKTLAMTEFYGAQAEIANDLAKARMDHSFGYDNAFDKAEAKFNAERKLFETTNNKIADENIKNNVVGFEESSVAQTEIDNQEEQKNIDEEEFNAQKIADRKAQEAKVAEAKARDAAEKLAIAEEAKARRTAEEAQAASQVASALASTEHDGITTDTAKARQEIILNAARRAAKHTEATVEATEFNGRNAAAEQAAKELAAAKAEEAVATGNAIIAKAKFEAEQQRIANAAIAEKEAQSLKAEQDAIERSKADELKTKTIADNAEQAAKTVQAEEDKAAEGQFKANTLQSNKDANAKRTFEAELNAEEEIAGVDATIRGDGNIYDSSLEAIKKQDEVDQKAWEDQATAEQLAIQEAKAERARYGASVGAAEQARANKLHEGDLLAEMANPEKQMDDNEEIAKGDAMEKKAAEEALAWEQEQYREQYGKAIKDQQLAHDKVVDMVESAADNSLTMAQFGLNKAEEEAIKAAEAAMFPPTTGYVVNGVTYRSKSEAQAALDAVSSEENSWYYHGVRYSSKDELKNVIAAEVGYIAQVSLDKQGMKDGDSILGTHESTTPETGYVYNGKSYKTKEEANAAWEADHPVISTNDGKVQRITVNMFGESKTFDYKLKQGEQPLREDEIRNGFSWVSTQVAEQSQDEWVTYVPKGYKVYGSGAVQFELDPTKSTATEDAWVHKTNEVAPQQSRIDKKYTFTVARVENDGSVSYQSDDSPWNVPIYIMATPDATPGVTPTPTYKVSPATQGASYNFKLYLKGIDTGISVDQPYNYKDPAYYPDYKYTQQVISGGGMSPEEQAKRSQQKFGDIQVKRFISPSSDTGTDVNKLIEYQGFSRGFTYDGKFYNTKQAAEVVRESYIDEHYPMTSEYIVYGNKYFDKLAAYSQLIHSVKVTDYSVFNHDVKAPSTSTGTLYK